GGVSVRGAAGAADRKENAPGCGGSVLGCGFSRRLILFDHLVGAGEQSRWDRKAERLCCLEVYDQFELHWRLHRQVSRLLTFEDAIDVGRPSPTMVNEIRSVGEPSPAVSIEDRVIAGRQPMTDAE